MVASIEDTPDLFKYKDSLHLANYRSISEFRSSCGPTDADIHGDIDDTEIPKWDISGIDRILDESDFTIVDFDSRFTPSIYHNKSQNKKIMAEYISDNRIDVDSRFRIVSVHIYSAEFLGLHMNLLHSDALHVVDRYMSGESYWSDSTLEVVLGSDLWETSMNIAYHELRTRQTVSVLEPHRKRGSFPPPNERIGFQLSDSSKYELVTLSLSFSFTGCKTARTWTCSVMGDRLAQCVNPRPDPQNGKHEDFRQHQEDRKIFIQEMHTIILNFGHDPVSARCLVAKLLVGRMFWEISQAYMYILKILNDELNISGKAIIFDGVSRDDYRFDKIFAYDWAISCLISFKECIIDALNKGEQMQVEMENHMKTRKDLWSEDLHHLVQELVDKPYKLRKATLEHCRDIVERQSKETTAYRDGISSLMSLREAAEASRTSAAAVEQGRHIQILTLITITYLPLSLATSVFSMSIIPDAANFRTFSWFLGIALGVTFLGVYNLRTISAMFTRSGKNVMGFARTRTGAENLDGRSRKADYSQDDHPVLASFFGEVDNKTPQMQPTSSWAGVLIYYTLITLPLTEVLATVRIFRTRYPDTKSTSSILHPATKAAILPNPTAHSHPGPPPASSRTNIWKNHCDVCPRCKPTSAKRGKNFPDICAVGLKIIRKMEPSVPQTCSSIPPPATVATAADFLESRQPARFDNRQRASEEIAVPLEHTQTQLPKKRLRWWTYGVLVMLRLVLLPLWVLVLLVDYLVILIVVGGYRIVWVVPDRKLPGGKDTKMRWRWWIMEPVRIIGKGVSIKRRNGEEGEK
ncbi:hypothetical protein EDC01DRAFT_676350 [Geopyxis carbonaria]|nr:hypothetical protein EDC01DRAFT_676350 [Geopyxis carbonaria]